MPGMLLPQSRFLHVPKTGGNWVSHALRVQFPGLRRMPKIHTTRRSAPNQDLFTFAFVRHPLTWYQSYFSYKQGKGWDPKNDWDVMVQSDSFEEFITVALEKTPAYYSKLLRRYVGRVGDEIDFVGRFESLVDDLIGALERAGEEFDADAIRNAPPVNRSSYDSYPAVFPDDLVFRLLESEAEAVGRFYSDDASNS
jgi:hypothetical protein